MTSSFDLFGPFGQGAQISGTTYPWGANQEWSDSISIPSSIGPGSVTDFVHDVMYPAMIGERYRLAILAQWARGNQPAYLVAPIHNAEKRALQALSKTPWLGLVVTTLAQSLYVDGYRAAGSNINAPGPWQTWNANNFQAKQIAIHRSALTFGYSYARALSGTAMDGTEQTVLRGLSPRKLFALYEDSVDDEYPVYALELMQNGHQVRFYTEDVYYDFDMPSGGSFPTPPTVTYHGTGVVPIVRYLNRMDLDGYSPGEVEELIASAMRIDKTDNDRMLAQHYNSWKVRTATGIDELVDASGAPVKNTSSILKNEDFLGSTNPEAKFGTLDETRLDGFIAAHETDVDTLAANAQLPPHLLTGKMVNLSAEALAAAQFSTNAKIYERKTSFGSSHNQLLRLAAHIEGDVEGAKDFTASVSWQDTSIRSLAQAADALGKLALMLGMPKEFLWSMVPGITQSDIETMKDHLMDSDPESVFLRAYGLPAPPPTTDSPPDDAETPPAAIPATPAAA